MNVKKILFAFSISFLTGILSLQAQDCKMYFPQKVGSVREMKSYTAKDKYTGKMVQEVLSKNVTGKNVDITVRTTVYDDKDAQTGSHDIQVRCENGVFKIDMTDYLSGLLQAYQSMEVEMKGDNLTIPASLNVGESLPDATAEIIVRSGGLQIMDMTVTIMNRKVEAREKMTTDAGTFDCYKMSYDVDSKTRLIHMTTKTVEWMAGDVGVVKSENYDKKGKLASYSVLTRFND